MKSVVLALGGNAIISESASGTIDEQYSIARQTMKQVTGLVRSGAKLLLTHGNGPIVGNIMIRNEAAKEFIPPMPLFICGADSQGGIGLMMQQALANELTRAGISRPVAAVVTQVVVDPDDPAFDDPSKPIGPFYTEEQGARIARERNWFVREDSNRGYRRAVASPAPKEVVELDVIRTLLDEGVIVIAAGGGGVPVFRGAGGVLRGVDAVVDKDLTSLVLARSLGFDTLVFVTGTDHAYLDFGTDTPKPLGAISLSELRKHHADGHFPAGSMGPKVDAAIEFITAGGKHVIIASPDNLLAAFDASSGTHVRPDPTP